jgi:hypothetical protein
MFKFIVIILMGYVFFKIVKNGAYLAINNVLKDKHLDEPTDLVQCAHCNKFTSRELVKKYKKMDFCCDECIDEYRKSS